MVLLVHAEDFAQHLDRKLGGQHGNDIDGIAGFQWGEDPPHALADALFLFPERTGGKERHQQGAHGRVVRRIESQDDLAHGRVDIRAHALVAVIPGLEPVA